MNFELRSDSKEGKEKDDEEMAESDSEEPQVIEDDDVKVVEDVSESNGSSASNKNGKIEEEENEVKPNIEDIKVEEEDGDVKSEKNAKRPADAMDIQSDEDDDELDVKRTKMTDDLELLKKNLPQVKVEQVEVPEDGGFTHHVTLPMDGSSAPLKPIENPVRTYAFKLDYFQERAITIVDNYQSVLVSAHTSAGKTTVAE